ncbi:MAG: SIS domain-containing protein [Bdellovibrionota bacterium]
MNFENELSHSLEESLRTKREFWDKHRKSFFLGAEMLWNAVQSDKKVLIFGNGGSACDAIHFAGEWVNRYKRDRRPLPCMALTADGPLLTCIGNDASFDEIFEKPVLAFGQTDDIAIGISTSGNSENVIRGLYAARSKGMQTIALVGGTGGRILKETHADIIVNVDSSKTTARIQETHEWILHAFCEYIDFQLLGPELSQ